MTKPWAFHSRSLQSLWETMELVMKINKINRFKQWTQSKKELILFGGCREGFTKEVTVSSSDVSLPYS